MIYPKLVREQDCKTDIHVKLYSEDISEEGEPIVLVDDDFKCNYQDGARRVLTDEKVVTELSGKAIFCKDIAPNMPVISGGEVTIFGQVRRIFRGRKSRNPDGTVNYVELEII